MDNSASLVPGRNPTGGPIYASEGFVPGAGTSSGINPILGNPNLPASAPPSNPYSPTVVPPLPFGANAGAYTPSNLLKPAPAGSTNVSTAAASPIGGASLLSGKDISRMYSDLKNTYGDGVAHAILNFLTTGAGFNQDAINNLLAAMQPGIERGTESLINQFSTTGNRFSSGAQIGLADYLSQVNLNQGQIEAQMYEQSVTDYMNTLMGVGATNAARKASSPSFMDKLTGILGIVGSGAGAASAAGIGGTAGSILDVIAALGGA